MACNTKRRRDFGTIQEVRKGELYRVFWQQGGRKRSHNVHGSERDAKDYLASVQVGIEGASDGTTFSLYWSGVVLPSIQHLKPKTRHEYVRMWDSTLAPMVGQVPMARATHRDCQAWMDSIEAPSTKRHAHALLRKVVKMAQRDGVVERDITGGIQMEKVIKAPRPIMDVAEVMPWLDSIRTYRHAARMLVILGCGLSESEAYALTNNDFERIDEHHVAISVTKTLVDVNGKGVLNDTPKNEYRYREVILGEPFSSELDLHMPMPGITNPSSANKALDWFKEVNAERIRESGVTLTVPSDLRPAFSIWCGEAFVPDSLVDMSMGHAGRTTRARNYQRSTRRAMMLVADSLTEYIEDNVPG